MNTWKFAMRLLILILALGLLVGASGCGSCDDDDNGGGGGGGGDDDTADDDTADDDTVDDDTVDDDTADDDDDTPLPEGVDVEPEDGAADVPLIGALSITSDLPLDPATLAFSFTDGVNIVPGTEKFSLDERSFYYFPDRLLDPAASYVMNFTLDDASYQTDFTTLSDPGVASLTGNADAAPGEAFGWKIIVDEVLVPSAFTEAIRVMLGTLDFLVAPIFLDVETQIATLSAGGGEATDFDGDTFLEINHGATGYQWDGELNGQYFSFAGSFDVEIRDTLITVDHFTVTGLLGENEDEELEIVDGYVSVGSTDCAGWIEAFPYLQWLIDQICFEDYGLFAYVNIHGEYNPLPDIAFDPPLAASDSIEVSFDPALFSMWSGVDSLNTRFEVYQEGSLVLTSYGTPDAVEFPDCCTQVDVDWYSFTTARFNIPAGSELAAGDYTLKFQIGGYGFESDFTI